MRVAVTGISGYLGNLLAKLLAADPRVDSILGLDLIPPRLVSPKLRFQCADLRDADYDALLSGIDVLFHLAFIVEPPRGMNMETIDRINIHGSRRLFAAAAGAGVPRIVYASSVAAYGAHPDNPLPLTEDAPLRPNMDWYYSRAKGLLENYLNELQAANPQLILVRFRPAILLGPTVNNVLGRSFVRSIYLSFNRDLLLDLVWDADVAAAFHLALGYPESDTFNLSGERPLSMAGLAALAKRRTLRLPLRPIEALVSAAGALRLAPPGMRDWLVSMRGPIVVSAARARERLGWRPCYDTGQTLLHYLEALQTSAGVQ